MYGRRYAPWAYDDEEEDKDVMDEEESEDVVDEEEKEDVVDEEEKKDVDEEEKEDVEEERGMEEEKGLYAPSYGRLGYGRLNTMGYGYGAMPYGRTVVKKYLTSYPLLRRGYAY